MKSVLTNYGPKTGPFSFGDHPPSFLSKQDSPHMHMYEPCEKVIAFHHFMSYNLT